MVSIKDELKSFKPKSIKTYDVPLNDIDDILNTVQNKINNIDKASKKNAVSMEILNEEIKEKNQQIINLKRNLRYKENEEEKFIKNFLNVLDQIEGVYEFAVKSQNDKLVSNIKSVMRIIEKEMKEIGFEEVQTIGEIFNAELHECVETINDDKKQKYEIVDVVKKGYKFKGKLIRVASVVAVK